MSEDQIPTPVPLPPPLRYLTGAEDNAVWGVIVAEPPENRDTAQLLIFRALGVLGLFGRPVVEFPEGFCNALKLAWDTTQQFDSMYLGLWFRCHNVPGHGGIDHYTVGMDWSDGEPGSVPATGTA
ncbi:hypothetical protein AB0392_06925 [Nonomuraea angiospora]|uniref:hypothetical protein n=1 Tax=Nonomuraea angiospora TaxID=46172 RepID=UPI00344D6876